MKASYRVLDVPQPQENRQKRSLTGVLLSVYVKGIAVECESWVNSGQSGSFCGMGNVLPRHSKEVASRFDGSGL